MVKIEITGEASIGFQNHLRAKGFKRQEDRVHYATFANWYSSPFVQIETWTLEDEQSEEVIIKIDKSKNNG